MREYKNLVATLYLKNGKAVKSIDNLEELEDTKNLIKLYNDSGIDKILIYDLSTEDEEHELNIHTIKELNRLLEIPLCAGGNINRLEDVKKLIYAGCKEVILNGSKPSTAQLAMEASKRFGKEKIIISLKNVDYIFKHQKELQESVHEILVMNQEILDSVENLTDIIYLVEQNELDMDKMKAAVKSALLNQKKQIRLADEDCYKKITVKSDDANLVQLCTTLNAYKDIQITYVFGSSRETLDGLELAKWVTGTNGTEIQVDRDKAVAYVKSLADKYDTYGNHKYKTTSGRDVVVYGKYGWKINQTAETDALVEAVKACQTTEREPIYESRGATHDGYDFGQTYIEVDLATQHLYFYKDGKVIIDSPFVSGNVSKNYTTPPGLFELYYKQKDRVLKGEDYATPVKYWMPFNGGIGLHDADWRSKFGGTIYQTNGSHGCINLPPKVAAQVYENAYKGIPIICCN